MLIQNIYYTLSFFVKNDIPVMYKVKCLVTNFFQRRLSVCLFIIIVIYYNYSGLLGLEFFNGDSYVFLPTREMVGDQLSYWWYIFTNSNGFGIQYRPLGFFGFFYISDYLFNSDPMNFRILALILLLTSSFFLHEILKSLKISTVNRYLGLFFYIQHSAFYYSILDVSCIAKYFFPSLILSFGSFLIISCSRFRLKKTIIVLISFISILFHEGSMVFPVIFLVLLILKDKKISIPNIFYILAPSIVYILFRSTVLEWPTESSFMGIGGDKFVDLFVLLNYGLWTASPLYRLSNIQYIIFIICILQVIYSYYSNKSHLYMASIFMVCSWVCLTPFSILKNHHEAHILMKGMTWGVLFIPISICLIFSNSNKYKIRYLYWLVIPLIFLSIISSNNYKEHMLGKYNVFRLKVDRVYYTLLGPLRELPVESKYLQINLNIDLLKAKKSNFYFYGEVFPAVLAHYFPKRKFVIFDVNGMYSLVDQGISFSVLNKKNEEVIVSDIYGVEYKKVYYGGGASLAYMID